MDEDFSILMAIYHGDDTSKFSSAYKSILNNSVLPKTIVLVRDGPIGTDLESCVYDFKAQSEALQIIFKQEILASNQGLTNALNVGLSKLTTKYAIRCDSDDINDPDRFKILMSKISEFRVSVIGSKLREVNFDKQERYRYSHSDMPRIKSYLRFRNPVNHMTVIYNVDDIRSVGGYPNYPFREDYALWCLLVSKGYHILNIDDTLVTAHIDEKFYRRRSGLNYIIGEIEFQKMKVSLGINGWFIFIICIIIRILALSAPSRMKVKLYSLIRHVR